MYSDYRQYGYYYGDSLDKLKKQILYEYIIYYILTLTGMISLNEYRNDINVNLEQRILLYIFVFTVAPLFVILMTILTAILFGNYDSYYKRFTLHDQEQHQAYKSMLYLGIAVYLTSLFGFLFGYFTKNQTPIHFAYIVIVPVIGFMIVFLTIPIWNCVNYFTRTRRLSAFTESFKITGFEEEFY